MIGTPGILLLTLIEFYDSTIFTSAYYNMDDSLATAVRRELPVVLRIFGQHFDKNSRVQIGSEEEKQLAQRHIKVGRQRAFVRAAIGGALGFGVLKTLGGTNRLLGFGLVGTSMTFMSELFMTQCMSVASAAAAGGIHGILSIREEFFLDLLALPDDKSPFARQCRTMYY
jgi:hypothetical protein